MTRKPLLSPPSPTAAPAQPPRSPRGVRAKGAAARTLSTAATAAAKTAPVRTVSAPAARRPSAAQEPTPTGPESLTRDAVLAAALAQIDERGVDAFSVRDLARTLGVYPTAVYWHVQGRNALIAGAVAQALGALSPPDPARPWQDELRALFVRYREAVRRHPRVAPVLGAQLVSNEGMNPRLVDHILALLEGAGFTGRRVADAYNVVIAAMVGFVTLELAPRPSDDPDGWAQAHARKLHATDPAQTPTLARHLPDLADNAFIVRWSSGRDRPLDAGFAAWCEVIVAGLSALKQDSVTRQP